MKQKIAPVFLIAILASIVAGIIVSGTLFGVNLFNLATVEGTFTFTAVGDSGFGGDTLANFQKAGSVGADFHLQLGDLSYGATTEQNWCNTFHQSQPNVFVVTGNHDYGESGGGNMDLYKIYCPFTFSGLNSGSGVAGSGYGFEYYFDYPSVNPTARIIATCAGVNLVNSGAGDCLYTPGSARANWLSQAIDNARTSGLWVIVFSHKLYVSTGPYGGDTGKEYFDLLLQKKVDLILMGHDHTYQRSKLLGCCFTESSVFDPSKVLESGPVYTRGLGSLNIIAGTGGWGLYTINTLDPDNGYFATWNGDNIGNSYGMLKVTVSTTSLTGEFLPVTNAFTDSWSIGGSIPPPGQLSSTLDFVPTSPIIGEVVNFSSVVSGGSPPYSYSWNIAGTSYTTSSVSYAFPAAGTFPVSLTVTDSFGAISANSKSITVSTSELPPPPPPPPPVTSYPFLAGWGGIGLMESEINPVNPPSVVFNSEQASDMELEIKRLVQDGWNVERVLFVNPLTTPIPQVPVFEYSDTRLLRTLAIAEYFHIYLVLNEHQFCDWADANTQCTDLEIATVYTNTQDRWIQFWQESIIPKVIGKNYVLLEPLNEPLVVDSVVNGVLQVWPGNPAIIAPAYQRFINMARAVGSTHWIIVENAEWDGDFPIVTDSLGKVFLNRHWYYGWPYQQSGYDKWVYDAGGNYVSTVFACPWSISCATSYAVDAIALHEMAEQKYGWTVLSTEVGADYLNAAPPDVQDTSTSCKYSTTTSAFVQAYINEATLRGEGVILWHNGDWSNGISSCLNTWGSSVVGPETLLFGELPIIGGGGTRYLFLGIIGSTAVIIGTVLVKRRK